MSVLQLHELLCSHSVLPSGHIDRLSHSIGVICDLVFLPCLRSDTLLMTVNGPCEDKVGVRATGSRRG